MPGAMTHDDLILAALACEWNNNANPGTRRSGLAFSRWVDHFGLPFHNLSAGIQILEFRDLMNATGVQIGIRTSGGHDINDIFNY